ncbi:MAG: glycoside hydrolase family 2 TIM barrel-domain containing protein [Rikenellaceae bacterium]
MRKILLLLIASISTIYVKGQSSMVSFNEGWSISIGGDLSEAITLPHHYNDDAYHRSDYFRGEAIYTKSLFLADSLSNNHYTLYFEGVNSSAVVVLNGEVVAQHKGGYTAFTAELTDNLRFGEHNTLEVRVDNRNENFAPLSGDFTIFGGIYRPIWLIQKGDISLDFDSYSGSGIKIITDFISSSKATPKVQITLNNRLDSTQAISLNVECISPDGSTTFSIREPHSLKRGLQELTMELPTIHFPKLWSPDEPNLYNLVVSVVDNSGAICDRQQEHFGLRWISIGDDNSLLLNGERIKLVGASRHQDREGHGIALSDRQHYEDMLLLKEMGANFVRLAHYPQSRSVLDACDRLGLLVWEEISVVDIVNDNNEFLLNAEMQLKEMIAQHYNHPSIIFWGYMNEVIIQIPYRIKDEKLRQEHYKATVKMAQYLDDICKEMDPSRKSVMAYHGSELYNELGLADVADISGWNLYFGWYDGELSDFEKFIATQSERYPNRPIIISEFGAGSDKRLHTLEGEKFDFSIEYQQEFMEHYWDTILTSERVMGGAMWNMVDFSSAARQESMPHINNKGLLYGDRSPKDIYFYHKARLNTSEPTTHIATRDWSRRVIMDCDSLQTIKVYSNEPQVELIIDSVSYGTHNVVNATASWSVSLPDREHTIVAKGAHSSDSTPLAIEYIAREIDPNSKVEININAGSNAYFYPDSSQRVFMPDMPYVEGSWGYIGGEKMMRGDRVGTTAAIRNSSDDPLFQTQREGDMSYQFDIPEGRYRVTLHFADLNFYGGSLAYDLGVGIEAERRQTTSFDIEINGLRVESSYSPSDIVGGNSALTKSYIITTTTPSLRIDFRGDEKGKAFINAISVENY